MENLIFFVVLQLEIERNWSSLNEFMTIFLPLNSLIICLKNKGMLKLPLKVLYFVAMIKLSFICVSFFHSTLYLTLSWRRPLSYRNQSTDLLCKSMDWFLYDNGLRHERVKNWIQKDKFYLKFVFIVFMHKFWLNYFPNQAWTNCSGAQNLCSAHMIFAFIHSALEKYPPPQKKNNKTKQKKNRSAHFQSNT